MSKRSDDDARSNRTASPTKRVPRVRARILRKARNPDVGYGKPPVEHQFKPGQSGNPRGRPRGRKSEAKMLDDVLYRMVGVRGPGGTRKIPVLEAMLYRFAEDSLKGNTKTAAFLLARHAAATSMTQEAPELSADDKAVVEAFLQDFAAKNGETNTSEWQSHEK